MDQPPPVITAGSCYQTDGCWLPPPALSKILTTLKMKDRQERQWKLGAGDKKRVGRPGIRERGFLGD